MNAMSEFVSPRNLPVGRVVETRRTFQAACPASHSPALRPTRGSGLGAFVDMLAAGAGAAPGGEPEGAHAAAERRPAATVRVADGLAIANRMTDSSSRGTSRPTHRATTGGSRIRF